MWANTKSLQIPFYLDIKDASELPFTFSYIIRKRTQIDSFNELPKEKRPTEKMIWEGKPEELEEWFDKVFDRKKKNNSPNDPGLIMEIDERLIEG